MTPAQAIERAVAERVGATVSVAITSIDTDVPAQRGLQALPDPAARTGAPIRFVMMVGGARRGVATATVALSAAYARARRAIARNEPIGADAVEIVEGVLPPLPLKRVPAAGDVIGRMARRDVAAGEVLSPSVLQVPPAVRAGDTVALTVVVGSIRVGTKAVASSSGHTGDVIRVLPEGGKPLKARVMGTGAVEVKQ